MRILLCCVVLLYLTPQAFSGCYQRRLCCAGRNNTCKDIDDGIGHIPTVSTIHSENERTQHRRPLPKEYATPYYEASGDGYDLVYPEVFNEERHEKIGKLIMPDVIEVEGSGGEYLYDKYGNEKPDKIVFGKRRDQKEPVIEVKKYLTTQPHPKHLLIRYSILSQFVPLVVGAASYKEPSTPAFPKKYYYLESGITECYCDEHCISLGDCCSDYTFTCPPRDCEVGKWGKWTSCKPDKGRCGVGTQQRNREVVNPADHGGLRCPALKEMKTCFVDCKKSTADDITTVALLLDYKYNSTRRKIGRNNIYWDMPSVSEKRKKATYYCVHYTITWVNRNCVSKLLSKGLTTGTTMCAECQPEAQLHRNNLRCASDLDDGDDGFWKLIGPKSCNGMWTRVNRTDNCHCGTDYPADPPFLLV